MLFRSQDHISKVDLSKKPFTAVGDSGQVYTADSIIISTGAQWPGMGLLFINAVYFVDIPIMSAYMIMVAFIFVMINFIVDITYYFIDPRIRIKDEMS